MVTSTIELNLSAIEHVTVTSEALSVDLSDGRSITVPLAWYPRLCTQRNQSVRTGD